MPRFASITRAVFPFYMTYHRHPGHPGAFALLLIAFSVVGLGATTPLTSFEDAVALKRISGSAHSQSSQHVTDGTNSLRVDFPNTDYPSIVFPAASVFAVTNWASAGALMFDAFNADSAKLSILIRCRDAEGKHCDTTVTLPPGVQQRVAVVLHLPNKVRMAGYPISHVCDADQYASYGISFLAKPVASVEFFLDRPGRAQTVYLDCLRLDDIKALTNIVDAYGQFTLDDWPGKIHADKELISRNQEETEALRAAAGLRDRDPWGGWAGGPQLQASGWFRTEKRSGKWWLVTPGGRLFWSVGMDCIGPDVSGPVRGLEELFSWKPAETDPLYAFGWKGGWVNFLGMNLYRTYGPNWEKPWLEMTGKRLRAWGFNTVGNWSRDNACRELRLPFTASIDYRAVEPFNGDDGSRSDSLSDQWAASVEKSVIATTAKWTNDPFCLGYFVDNELPWPTAEVFAASALGLPGDRAVKQRLTARLRDKYGEIASLNTAWEINVSSWDKLQAKPVQLPKKRSAALLADSKELLAAFAERYYSTVVTLMKKHAPNQLYLGSRFSAVPPDEAALASAKYCDVVSYNIYGKTNTVLSRGQQIVKFDKPVLIGEFHFGALDRGMFSGGMVRVASQQERGFQYAEYLKTALAQPWCVGAHWFQYVDEPLTSRGDGENFNIGFVSIADVP